MRIDVLRLPTKFYALSVLLNLFANAEICQFSAARTEGLIYFSYFSDAATCLGAILLGPGEVVLADAVLGACGAVNHAVATLRRFAD